MTVVEKHYCINCNWELNKKEVLETLNIGCPFCGAQKGLISLETGTKPIQLPDTYLDNYLSTINLKIKEH